MRFRALLFSATLSMALASPVFAQGDAAKLEQATKLYEEATKLLDEKRFDEACPKLEQAVQLVPVASGAQLALGACYEGKGKLGSAYRRYEEAAALAKAANQAEREQRAREALAAVSPRVARLTVTPSANMRAVNGFVTKLDGFESPKATWGNGQPIDAGDHDFRAEAPGYSALDVKVSIIDGENKNLEIDLSKVGAAPPPPPVDKPTEAPREESEGGSPLRTAGIVIGGVGVAGLAVGAVTGGLALGKKSDGDEGCAKNDPNLCPSPAVAAREDGFTFATISTIGFIAGGALLAGGVVLFVVGGDSGGGESTAQIKTEARPGGVVVSGAF